MLGKSRHARSLEPDQIHDQTPGGTGTQPGITQQNAWETVIGLAPVSPEQPLATGNAGANIAVTSEQTRQ